MIRDIGGVETQLIYEGSFNPVYTGSFGGTVGTVPPKLPLRGVGGGLQGTVGGSLTPTGENDTPGDWSSWMDG